MFCDAAGSPAHLAAVLLMDGQTYFTHAAPSQKVMKAFYHRRDNQIMGLELLAISLGLETFKELLSGRRVVIHSDNSGSEVGSFAFLSLSCGCMCAMAGVSAARHSKELGSRPTSTRPVATIGIDGQPGACAESRY